MIRLSTLSLLLLMATGQMAHSQAVAVHSNAGPDADAYGAGQGYPQAPLGVMTTQATLVGTYSHYDEARPHTTIPASANPSMLTRAPAELQLNYQFDGNTQSLESYLQRNPTTGLLIMRDGQIAFEHYQYGRTAQDRFTSQSMAKGIVGIMLGIAIADGAVHSADDTVATYLPELAGTEPGKTPLRYLLTMTSGLRFHEVYDGKDDIMRLNRALNSKSYPGIAAIMQQFDARSAAPGQVFNYSGLDTELLALVISRATGMGLGDYVNKRLWTPMRAEAAASWITDAHGDAVAYCCFNATLRDYGRLGTLLAHDGMAGGTQVIPKTWMLEATTPQSPLLAPGVSGRKLGYGYQIWLLPGDRRAFALRGIHGQVLLVDPASKTVLVHTAVRPNATNNLGEGELLALWNALVAHNAGL